MMMRKIMMIINDDFDDYDDYDDYQDYDDSQSRCKSWSVCGEIYRLF